MEKDPTKFCTDDEFTTGVSTLKEFCLLRAQSIAGQLEGTIPATSDAQNQDSSSLIDASYLTISDMGSMNNGMGGMDQPGAQPDAQAPGAGQENSQADPSFSKEAVTNGPDQGQNQNSPGQTPGQMPENPDFDAGSAPPSQPASDQTLPENFENGTRGPVETAAPQQAAGLIALSVLALAAGIAVAALYRKRA